MKTSIQALIKHKRIRKSSSELSVAENLDWKPGLKFWSNKKWRQFQHGLNEHGVFVMFNNSSLLLMVEPNLKYIWH